MHPVNRPHTGPFNKLSPSDEALFPASRMILGSDHGQPTDDHPACRHGRFLRFRGAARLSRAARELVIVGGVQGRGVVAAASYEARKFGVHSAMPISTARRLCPNGIYVPVRMKRYAQFSRQVFEILGSFTP